MAPGWHCAFGFADVPPSWSGVYAIYDGYMDLVYIGSSAHLRSRIGTHLRSERFQTCACIKFRRTADGFTARLLERKLIRRLRPSRNKVVNVALRVRGPEYYGLNPYDYPQQ